MSAKRKKSHRVIRRRKRTQREKLLIGALSTALMLIVITGVAHTIIALRKPKEEKEITSGEKYNAQRPELDVQLLTPNKYSRPGTALKEVNGIVVHYTANPGTTARQNRDYFEGLAKSKITKASSHFIIGLKGEIVQCIPCAEISYASNNRNRDTISIECCISDDSGKFNNKTYQSLIRLTTWLMGRYELKTEDVIRHYDVTGKNCPKYFVEHPAAWEKFKKDLDHYIKQYGVVRGSRDDPLVTETE